MSQDPFPGVLTQPASLTPYLYALNSPVLYRDPSGEVVPIVAIASVGFVAGAIYNAYQQTNGFANFCKFDVLQMLAAGVGGAAATTSLTLMAVSGVGLLGMGFQGLTLSGFFGAGWVSILVWSNSTSAVGWSNAAMLFLFSNTSTSPPPIKPGSAGGPSAGKSFPDSVRKQAFDNDPTKTFLWCRRSGTATDVDHIIPKSKGGNATIDNAQLACPHCNRSRQAGPFPKTPPEDYYGPWPPSWWPN